MTNDIEITRTISDEGHLFVIEVDYTKGRGIMVRTRKEKRGGTSRSFFMFAHGNEHATVHRIARARPKLLRETGERLRAADPLLFDLMEGWFEEERWPRARQADFFTKRLLPYLGGDLSLASLHEPFEAASAA